jgi:hypothetical protein
MPNLDAKIAIFDRGICHIKVVHTVLNIRRSDEDTNERHPCPRLLREALRDRHCLTGHITIWGS